MELIFYATLKNKSPGKNQGISFLERRKRVYNPGRFGGGRINREPEDKMPRGEALKYARAHVVLCKQGLCVGNAAVLNRLVDEYEFLCDLDISQEELDSFVQNEQNNLISLVRNARVENAKKLLEFCRHGLQSARDLKRTIKFFELSYGELGTTQEEVESFIEVRENGPVPHTHPSGYLSGNRECPLCD